MKPSLSRHLHIIKPALEMLLQQVGRLINSDIKEPDHCQHLLFNQVEANPETNGLRRLLAVKKSLAEFEQNVELVSKEIFHFSIIAHSSLGQIYLNNLRDCYSSQSQLIKNSEK